MGRRAISRRYSIKAFESIEAGRPIDTLYYYWDALRKGRGAAPQLSDFRPFEIFPDSILKHLSWIDTNDENPENYRLWNHHGGRMEQILGSLEGQYVGAYPNAMHRNASIREYQLCKVLKRPIYHQIDQKMFGACRMYRRMLMPLLDERGNVVRIAYGIRTSHSHSQFVTHLDPQT